MYIEKLFLRGEDGVVRASLTIMTENGACHVKLPQGYAFVIATDGAGSRLDPKTDAGELLFSETPAAILAERDGMRLYAFREGGALRKWELLSALTEEAPKSEAETMTTNAEISEETEETSGHAEESSEERSEEAPQETVAMPDEDPKHRKLREIFERGEPFPGFERLIEGSKWVRMPEEDYLIGIVGDVVLYGVPGRLGEAPDENCDWTFLPVSEDSEDWGYYICKSSDLE